MTLAKTLLLILFPILARADSCLEYPYSMSGDPLAADIAALRTALAPFDSLTRSLDTARPRICAKTDPSEALGTFGAEENVITVGADLDTGKRVAVLIHEMRHLDQAERGICLSSTLSMRENARAVFALEADAMAVTHLVAWRSLESGDAGIFEALRTGPETRDIAAAFEATMADTEDPAQATAAAFDAWYQSDARRERYYISTCMAYLDRMEAAAALPGTTALSADFLARACRLPDQTSYPCKEPERPIPR